MRNNYLTYNHLTRIKVEQGKPESLKKIFYSVGSLPVFIEAGVGLSFNHITGSAENTRMFIGVIPSDFTKPLQNLELINLCDLTPVFPKTAIGILAVDNQVHQKSTCALSYVSFNYPPLCQL